jgi:hypothetical protein
VTAMHTADAPTTQANAYPPEAVRVVWIDLLTGKEFPMPPLNEEYEAFVISAGLTKLGTLPTGREAA